MTHVTNKLFSDFTGSISRYIVFAFIGCIIGLLLVVGQGLVSAQGADESFAVGPGKQEVELLPGETVTKQVSISNGSSRTKTFSLSVEDLVGSDNPNETVILKGDEKGPYSIRDYVSFDGTEITVGPYQTEKVNVYISAPADAEPGGYYGAVIVTESSDQSQTDGTGAVLVSRIGSLLLAKVAGEVREEGQLTEFKLPKYQTWFVEGQPEQFEILFKNTGSVHLVPYGIISIKNLFGSVVDTVPVDAYFALPDSTRSRLVEWEEPRKLFGYYRAELELNRGYDSSEQIDTDSLYFVVMPYKVIAIVLGILVLLGLMIGFMRRNFEVKKKK